MQINEYGKPDSPLVLIQPVDDHDLSWIEIEAGWIKEYAGMDFRLLTVISGRFTIYDVAGAALSRPPCKAFLSLQGGRPNDVPALSACT